jgi:hypothetical protein
MLADRSTACPVNALKSALWFQPKAEVQQLPDPQPPHDWMSHCCSQVNSLGDVQSIQVDDTKKHMRSAHVGSPGRCGRIRHCAECEGGHLSSKDPGSPFHFPQERIQGCDAVIAGIPGMARGQWDQLHLESVPIIDGAQKFKHHICTIAIAGVTRQDESFRARTQTLQERFLPRSIGVLSRIQQLIQKVDPGIPILLEPITTLHLLGRIKRKSTCTGCF